MDLKDKTKMDIKRELITKDLDNLLISIIIFLLITGIFGYVGYIFSECNNIDISHGIIYGAIFPAGIILLRAFEYDNLFTCIVYTIAYITIIGNIPTFVGAIILFAMILVFIVAFIYAIKKDRTKEIEEYYNEKKQNDIIAQNDRRTAEDIINEYEKAKVTQDLNDDSNDDRNEEIFENEEENVFEDDYDIVEDSFLDEDEEFECEMCFKKISREEYELYDCMCEECFIDAHTDKYGNFHEDEFFDF